MRIRMRPEDSKTFVECARSLRIWILVRKTNDASLRYVAKPGFIPRPADCQAKTADLGAVAGLVVDPELVPEAFSEDRVAAAREAWREFLETFSITEKYKMDNDPESPRFGCPLYQGSYIHADYDLFDVILSRKAEANLALVGDPRARQRLKGPVVRQIQRFVNPRIGSPMVRSWGEARPIDMSESDIHVFGPMGQTRTLENSEEINGFYRDELQRPKPLGPRSCIALYPISFRIKPELRLVK